MKLTATFQAPRVNFSQYKAQLQQTLGEAIAHAALEWLGATTALIPVWSGASQATFLPLASAIGFQLAISPVSRAPDRVDLGTENSTGEITTDANKGEFSFTYTTSLAHLIYNEFNNANIVPDPTLFSRLLKPGPYRFQDAGQKAFQAFASRVRLPDPRDSIVVKPIRVR